jgi:GTP-binding protein HflX
MTTTIDLRSAAEERALLVQGVVGRRPRADAERSLEELRRLADTAGARVAGSISQRVRTPTPNFFVGEGKLQEIKLACDHTRANLIIFDNELTSVQVNNLDLSTGIKVIDRTELILQIFARRARSAEAQVQVELAQLEYLIGRIPVSERQQRFKGGIGMKGPGESPFQLRRLPMQRRIHAARRRLALIGERRRRTRAHRTLPCAALVGYTNAGKSTLLNALASAQTYVDDRLFATLDTKTAATRLPGGRSALLTDTVGFIRDLPHGLVASFRSTLDEVSEADLLLVVADASDPDVAAQLSVVEQTLADIGAAAPPRLLVLNKADRCAAPPDAAAFARGGYADILRVSALRGAGLAELRQRIAQALPPPAPRPDAPGWRRCPEAGE